MTGMLVTASLYLSVNSDLPTTSSLKMIDLWMLFALAIPFMEIILQTSMAYIRQTYDLDKPKETVDIGNETDEINKKRTNTPTARREGKVGPSKIVVKNLIKEAIEEAITAAVAARDDKDHQRKIEIDTKEAQVPIIRRMAWNENDEKTWPKIILRYFVNYFQIFVA